MPSAHLGDSALASETSSRHHKSNTAVSGGQTPEQAYYTGRSAYYPSPCSTTASRTTSGQYPFLLPRFYSLKVQRPECNMTTEAD